MNKFFATVRVKGQFLRTAVFADSSLHARLILEYQFGFGSVVVHPVKSTNPNEQYTPLQEIISAIKPLTPQQARLDTLKRQKDVASHNLKAERERQKISKAQQQLRTSSVKKFVA
jgi:hypothetical protein